jgi:hypothetical protein
MRSWYLRVLGASGRQSAHSRLVGNSGPSRRRLLKRVLAPTLILAMALGSAWASQFWARHATAMTLHSFAAPQTYPAGGEAYVAAVGDFNEDGHPDVLAPNALQATVSVLLDNANGALQPPLSVATGAVASGNGDQSVAVGDFNDDGHLDVAIPNLDQTSVSVLLGDGAGSFMPVPGGPIHLSFGIRPFSIIAGDFNGDHQLDVAFRSTNPAVGDTEEVIALLGRGDGSFQAPQVSTFPFRAEGISVVMATGDFNGDGRLDLALTLGDERSGFSAVGVMLGRGDGTFQPPQTYDTGQFAWGIAVGDVNGDGRLDLVATIWNFDPHLGGVSVLLGRGDGSFQPPQMYATGLGLSTAVVVGDFNGDGQLDVAVNGGDVVGVLVGHGDGSFNPVAFYSGHGVLMLSLAVGDLNGDGFLDLVTANGGFPQDSVSVLLNTASRLLPTAILSVGAPHATSAGGTLFVTSATPLSLSASEPGGAAIQSVSYRVCSTSCGAEAYTTMAGNSASFTLNGVDGPYEVDSFATDTTGDASTPASQVVTLDNAGPGATFTVPTNGANYLYQQALFVNYTCDDGSGSGVATCLGAQANGAALNTTALGLQSLTVNATDQLGNSRSSTVTYGVGCPTSGVLPPVSASGAATYNAGRTVPVALQLQGSCASLTSARLTLYLAPIVGGTPGAFTPATPSGTSNSGNVFRYNSTTGQYLYNLNTRGLAAGVYQLDYYIGGTSATGALLGTVQFRLV